MLLWTKPECRELVRQLPLDQPYLTDSVPSKAHEETGIMDGGKQSAVINKIKFNRFNGDCKFLAGAVASSTPMREDKAREKGPSDTD